MESATSSDDSAVSSTVSSSDESSGAEQTSRRQPAADLASSSEDDSDSSDEEDDRRERRGNTVRRSSNNDDSSASEDEDGQDSDASSEEEAPVNEEVMSLAERIKRNEERGDTTLRDRRERKSKARKIASQRLAKMKKEKSVPGEPAKKKSKHAPTEASSKRKDFWARKTTLNESGIGVTIGAHRYKPCDPRMSNLQGHLDVNHFEHNYEFLQDVREKEVSTLKKRMTAWKASGRKGQKKRRELGLTQDGPSMEQDQTELRRLLQEKADVAREQVVRAAKHTVKKKLQQDVAEGKSGVYFPKKREMKRLHLEAKFEEMRKRGGDKAVDKAVAKRRKKNKSKDSGRMGSVDY